MPRQELVAEFERRKVPTGVIKAGLGAYDYLTDNVRCPGGAAYPHEIAQAVFGIPTMGWNPSQPLTDIALEILVEKGVLVKRDSDKRYRVAQV